LLLAGVSLLPGGAGEAAGPGAGDCRRYSDSFDTFNPLRWQEVMFYAAAPDRIFIDSQPWGTVSVEEGALQLSAAERTPVEIQVYSLFTFSGDFDIETAYRIPEGADLTGCRFNAGLVLQTLDGEINYKCYVAATPDKGLLYRARLDRFGEINREKYLGGDAGTAGLIRVVRREGRIAFLIRGESGWERFCTFERPSTEKLRARFKLQTSDETGTEGKGACPVQVAFGRFQVNGCDQIGEE
jgi:hypothetical protein